MRSPVVFVTWLCLVAVVAVVAEPAAWAKPPRRRASSSEEPATPWSQGVPRPAQKRALELFREGNALFEESKYTDAVAIYERALAAWDHPNIRFNMALCLISMRQPLAAWRHLQQALRFGAAPLGERIHAEARRTAAVLDSSLAQLTVRSNQPGIRVMVDGGTVLRGPGEHTMKLLAGKHQLVASRRGYVTDSRALELPAGKPVVEEIALDRERVRVLRVNYERRWAWWVPWSVAAGSVALAAAGGGVYLDARADIKDYDRAFAEMCPSGCTDDEIPGSLKDQERSARQRSGIAIGMWGTAGALLVTGGVMAIINRPRKQEVRMRTTVPVAIVSPDYVGVGVSLSLD